MLSLLHNIMGMLDVRNLSDAHNPTHAQTNGRGCYVSPVLLIEVFGQGGM